MYLTLSVAISKSLVIYEANPNDIATMDSVAPITKPTQGAACEGDTRVRGEVFGDSTFDERVSIKIVYMYTTSCAHLPAEVLVVRVTHVETLGGEGVGLNLHIGSRDLVDEAGLANVRETYDGT